MGLEELAGEYNRQLAVIEVGASKSNLIQCLGWRLAGVLVPANCEGTHVKFWADVDGSALSVADMAVLVNGNGDEIRLAFGSSTKPVYIALDQTRETNGGVIPPCAQIAIETIDSGDSYSAIVQADADATFGLVFVDE